MDRTRLKPWQRLFGKSNHPNAAEALQIQGLLPFSYSPLSPGTIRLLVAESHSQSAGHKWRLQTAHLDPELEFDALSYTWGPLDQKLPISLDGRCAYVHHNLYTALPYLATRSKEQRRRPPIWIDAICINQDDEKEKAEQIASMHLIYRLANTVWAWLGLAEDQSSVGQAVARLERLVYVERKKAKSQPQINRDTIWIGLEAPGPVISPAIKHIMENPWFRRVWVVQEVALAQKIAFICGEHEIAFDVLKKAMHHAPATRAEYDALGEHVGFDQVLVYEGILLVRDKVLSREGLDEQIGEVTLLMDVSYTMAMDDLQCSLPEDRVLGILGLCQSPAVLNLKLPDSVDVVTLYTNFSKHLLTIVEPDARWWMWIGLTFGFARRPDLPSWVPDLHQQKAENKCELFGTSLPYHYTWPRSVQASSKKTRVRSGNQLNELLIKGKILDQVAMASEEVPPPLGFEKECVESLLYLCSIADWDEAITSIVSGERAHNHMDGQFRKADNGLSCMEDVWEALMGAFLFEATGTTTREEYRLFRLGMRKMREIAKNYAVCGLYVALDDILPVRLC
jgi:hypothetical protein